MLKISENIIEKENIKAHIPDIYCSLPFALTIPTSVPLVGSRLLSSTERCLCLFYLGLGDVLKK